MAGFLIPILFGMLFTHTHESSPEPRSETNTMESNGVDIDTVPKQANVEDESGTSNDDPPKELALASSILLGDAFHNFTDGVFIGNAFLLCGKSLAWTMVLATIYHEIAQEISDFALLVHHCGLTQMQALVLNFLSGFSVLIGAVLILAADLSEKGMGVTLALSAGVYLYISAAECVPRINHGHQSVGDKLLFIVFYILGAVPIGLVLLNHEHCDDEH